MSELKNYFSRPLPDDERLTNYQAYIRGVFAGLTYLQERLSGYHDLLEIELDESPAGQIYLNESRIAFDKAVIFLRL